MIPELKTIKCIGAKAQDEKMHLITTKTNKGLIFNFQNSQLLTLSLLTEEIFQAPGQNRPVVNLPVVHFHFQL